jgi:hypothetical protein
MLHAVPNLSSSTRFLIILCEDCRLWNSSLTNFSLTHCHVIHFSPHILLNSLFSCILVPCPSLNVRDQISLCPNHFSWCAIRERGQTVAWWLRHNTCATSRKVACSRPNEVNEFFSIYLILQAAIGPGVYSASNINKYRKQKNVFGEWIAADV